jgi:hypothetical protein
VAGRVAAKTGGKHGGADAKRREKFLLRVQKTRFIDVGFSNPDFQISGSPTPISSLLLFFFSHGAGEWYYRVHHPRNNYFGFL